jgi:exportin-7
MQKNIQESYNLLSTFDSNFMYKGMALCLVILQRALCGNYVNFGVFALYGDMALSNALGIALKLALSFPLEDMLVCGKV